MDANTGAPKSDVKLIAQKRSYFSDAGKAYETISEQTTDPSGFANITIHDYTDQHEVRTCFVDGDDVFLSPDYNWRDYVRYFYSPGRRWNRYGIVEDVHIYANIYTDRTVYRPSQQVNFKIILYQISQGQTKLITDEKVTVK